MSEKRGAFGNLNRLHNSRTGRATRQDDGRGRSPQRTEDRERLSLKSSHAAPPARQGQGPTRTPWDRHPSRTNPTAPAMQSTVTNPPIASKDLGLKQIHLMTLPRAKEGSVSKQTTNELPSTSQSPGNTCAERGATTSRTDPVSSSDLNLNVGDSTNNPAQAVSFNVAASAPILAHSSDAPSRKPPKNTNVTTVGSSSPTTKPIRRNPDPPVHRFAATSKPNSLSGSKKVTDAITARRVPSHVPRYTPIVIKYPWNQHAKQFQPVEDRSFSDDSEAIEADGIKVIDIVERKGTKSPQWGFSQAYHVDRLRHRGLRCDVDGLLSQWLSASVNNYPCQSFMEFIITENWKVETLLKEFDFLHTHFEGMDRNFYSVTNNQLKWRGTSIPFPITHKALPTDRECRRYALGEANWPGTQAYLERQKSNDKFFPTKILEFEQHENMRRNWYRCLSRYTTEQAIDVNHYLLDLIPCAYLMAIYIHKEVIQQDPSFMSTALTAIKTWRNDAPWEAPEFLRSATVTMPQLNPCTLSRPASPYNNATSGEQRTFGLGIISSSLRNLKSKMARLRSPFSRSMKTTSPGKTVASSVSRKCGIPHPVSFVALPSDSRPSALYGHDRIHLNPPSVWNLGLFQGGQESKALTRWIMSPVVRSIYRIQRFPRNSIGQITSLFAGLLGQ